MKKPDHSSLKKLRKQIKKVQDSKRFEHTLGVEYTAAALAMRYDCDIQWPVCSMIARNASRTKSAFLSAGSIIFPSLQWSGRTLFCCMQKLGHIWRRGSMA